MINDLSPYDRVVQEKMWPTVIVPKRSQLAACGETQTRFLMAADGLYLHARRPWGELIRRLWDCSFRGAPLPYGPIEERDDFAAVLRDYVMPIVSEVMVPEAACFAESGKEWVGFVVWDGSEFVPWAVEFQSGALYADPGAGLAGLPQGWSLVADIHSHIAPLPPFFSRDDNRSDNGRVKISVVLGDYRLNAEGGPCFNWKARYCVEGFFLGEHCRDDEDPPEAPARRVPAEGGEEVMDGEEYFRG